MLIAISAALDENGLIGDKNRLPWHLPADLKRFKTITLNKPIIMGRKTFESIGRALPQRRSIVISHSKNYDAENCEVVTSLKEALEKVANAKEVIIIGGRTIYAEALPIAKKLYLTIIHHRFPAGDCYFPPWNKHEWRLLEKKEFAADKDNPYPYDFLVYELNNKP